MRSSSILAAAVLICLPVIGFAAAKVPPPPDFCKASTFQYLVGSDAKVLENIEFTEPMRRITLGMFVTMDFLPSRLNIKVNKNNVITRVYCG
jgi:hypothetical protein